MGTRLFIRSVLDVDFNSIWHLLVACRRVEESCQVVHTSQLHFLGSAGAGPVRAHHHVVESVEWIGREWRSTARDIAANTAYLSLDAALATRSEQGADEEQKAQQDEQHRPVISQEA